MIEKFWYGLYNLFFLPLLRMSAFCFQWFFPKIRKGIQGRRNLFQKLETDIQRIAGQSPRIWIHNSSLGEFEQAKPLIMELKKRFPHGAIIVSFFSPSGFDHAGSFSHADVICYLPVDTIRNASRFVDLVKPDILIVIRHDIWPNHLRVLKKRGIPAILINFSMRPRGYFRWFPGAIRTLFGQFNAIFTVSPEVEAFPWPFQKTTKWMVCGDTRYDQVIQRAKARAPVGTPLKSWINKRVCLIFGSTWAKDEAVIFPPLKRLFSVHSNLCVILAPHEPTESHLRQIEKICRKANLSSSRLSRDFENTIPASQICIVDRVGILAGLYALADVAWVGGGFGRGVHSVLEPAVFGIPVFFGPHCKNALEALQLEKRNAGKRISDAETLYHTLEFLLSHPKERKRMGKNALDLVQENAGATGRIVSAIETFLNAHD